MRICAFLLTHHADDQLTAPFVVAIISGSTKAVRTQNAVRLSTTTIPGYQL